MVNAGVGSRDREGISIAVIIHSFDLLQVPVDRALQSKKTKRLMGGAHPQVKQNPNLPCTAEWHTGKRYLDPFQTRNGRESNHD